MLVKIDCEHTAIIGFSRAITFKIGIVRII